MSQEALIMSPRTYRETVYREALEAFLTASARYLNHDIRKEVEADSGAPHAPAKCAGDQH